VDSFSRFTQPAWELDKYFDYISNSYYEGLHKKDNQGELFLKYANKFGAPIGDCLLFDDSIKVCETFTELGGRAYWVTSEQDIIYHLKRGF